MGSTDDARIVSIHQPNYVPWSGYFYKMAIGDVHVLLDDVVYDSKGFTNRNRVRTPEGWTWLTVPVHSRDDTRIEEVRIANEHEWRRKHWKTLQTYYNNAPHLEAHRDALEAIYDREWEWLADLNVELIEHVRASLGLETELVRSSTLEIEGRKSELNLGLTRAVGGTVYLSGPSGREYLDQERFASEGIGLVFAEFEHPVYDQVYPGFEPRMSVLDLLFNTGPEAPEVLMEPNRDRAEVLAAASPDTPIERGSGG